MGVALRLPAFAEAATRRQALRVTVARRPLRRTVTLSGVEATLSEVPDRRRGGDAGWPKV